MDPKRGIKAFLDNRDKLIKRLRNLDPNLATQVAAIQLDWYRLRASSTEETTEVFIYDEIDPWWGLSADSLVRELNDITTPNIDVRINSPGGSVYDAVAIYNALVRHPSNVTVYVDSLAASAASIVAMGGDRVVMMVGAQLMIHDAMGIEIGNAADMRAMADFLDKQSDNLASIYAARAGGEVKDWRDLMLAETWMFAEEAVEIGLADEVYTKPDNAGPAEGSPEEEQQESPAEEQQEEPEEGSDGEPPDEGEQVAALMGRRHVLANRNFKYAGRRRAPMPVNSQNVMLDSDWDVDKLIDAMLEGK